MPTYLINKLNDVIADNLTIKLTYLFSAVIFAIVMAFYTPIVLKAFLAVTIFTQIAVLLQSHSSYKSELVIDLLQVSFVFTMAGLLMLTVTYNADFKEWIGHCFKIETYEALFNIYALVSILFLFFALTFKFLLNSFKDINNSLKEKEWQNENYMDSINYYSTYVISFLLFQSLMLCLVFKY